MQTNTPDALRRFALFGMGARRKLLYRDGQLLDALSGELLREWSVAAAEHEPGEYRVTLDLRGGGQVAIWEDEAATWLSEGGEAQRLSEGRVNLPRFGAHPQARLLRRLHHELLVNIVPAGPVPNLLVYAKPWYRDAALVAMCLQRTGNLHLLADWIAGLREPFDGNNGGNCEPDNLGQLLYMVSLVAPRSAGKVEGGKGAGGHPLVPEILAAAEGFRRGDHIVGLTDGAEHPAYQTKWLKFGLRALGLPDPWVIPEVYDSYSALFWMDYRDEHVAGERFASEGATLYPYLAWAGAHFHGWPPPSLVPPLGGESGGLEVFPLTWEAHASEADYSRMAIVGPEYAQQRISVPHTWHAAEMFLYALDC